MLANTAYDEGYEFEEDLAFDEELEGDATFDDELDELSDEIDWRALLRTAAGPAASFAVAGGARLLKKKAPWWLAPTAGAVVGGLVNLPRILMADEEDERDWLETEAAPQIIAEMEHLGYLAERAETEEEANEFLAALVPLAARLVPKAASLVSRVAPRLIRGAARLGRTLRRSPATRRLVRAVPTIVRQATTRLARQAVAGRAPTPRRATRALRQQAVRTLSNRRRRQIALRRCLWLNRRLQMQNRALRRHIMMRARRRR